MVKKSNRLIKYKLKTVLLSGVCGKRWGQGSAQDNVLVMSYFFAEFKSIQFYGYSCTLSTCHKYSLQISFIRNNFKMQSKHM